VRLCKHLDFGTESFDASHDPGIREIYFKDNGRQGRLARSLDGTWLFALAGQRYQSGLTTEVPLSYGSSLVYGKSELERGTVG
jgi:hypothetical protein